MTLTSVRLAGSLQTLIDSRLDTIERMLMGRVPRQDRLAIVKDVEAQIFDILGEGGNQEPTREDVLAALARLDPPEAYLSEDGEIGEERPAVVRRPATVRAVATQPGRAVDSRVGKISGILGITMMVLSGLIPMIFLLGEFLGTPVLAFTLWFGYLGLIFVGSLIGLTLACVARFRGAWSIVGGVLGPISILLSIVGLVFLLLNL